MLYPCIPFNNLRLLNLSIIHTYRQPQIVFKHFKGYYMKINYKEQCAICGKICDVKNHIKEHNIQSKDYYDKYIKLPDEGICKTCGLQTPYRGLIAGYPQLYCSNKCKAQNPIEKAKHSATMKNKTKKEKEETRKKQIETWKRTMGDDWAKIMNQHACESYDKKHLDKDGNPITTGGPFASKEVRKKCEKTWGGVSSPSCNQETRDKLSKVQSKLWNENNEYYDHFRESFYKNTLSKYQQMNPNILDYDGEKITYKCTECGEITQFGLSFLRKRLKYNLDLCLHCEPKHGVSNQEKNLLNYIREIYTEEIIENDKSIISPKELDIVLPKLKLAFEYDGVYWHMDSRIYDPTEINKTKNMTAKEIWEYDRKKDLLCEQQGYKLYHIKEIDWINDNINTKKFIKNIISEVNI